MKTAVKGYIWGPVNAEDLLPVPGTDWVIASGMTGPGAPLGRIYAIHAGDHSNTEAYPYLVSEALDRDRFGDIDPPDPKTFEPHGIDIFHRADGIAELFVVNHGARESVEVFEIDTTGVRPTLRWIGGVVLPANARGNDVAAVAGGGFLVTSFADQTGGHKRAFERVLAGEKTGCVLEWSPALGWSTTPGTQVNSANGVAVSADGKWVYVVSTFDQLVRRVPRNGEGEVLEVATDIDGDNFTWTPDGQLLLAGVFDITPAALIGEFQRGTPHVGAPSRIIRMDPATLAWEAILEYGPETLGIATTGVRIGDEIWVGSARGAGIGRFDAPR